MKYLGLFAVIVAAPVALLHAQGQSVQVGEILESGGGQQVKVLGCRPVAYGRECDVVLWQNGQAASNPSTSAEADLIKWDARVRAATGRPPRAGVAKTAPSASAAPRPAQPAPKPAGGRVPDGTYSCQLWMGNSYVNLGKVRSVNGQLSPNPLAKVGATITGVAPSAGGITISYKTARGYNESMDCTRG